MRGALLAGLLVAEVSVNSMCELGQVRALLSRLQYGCTMSAEYA